MRSQCAELKSEESDSRRTRNTLSLGESVAQWAGWIARGCVLLTITVAPWAFGAIDAWVEELLALLLTCAFFAWLLGLTVRRHNALVLPVAILPLVLFISWGLMQLIPMSRSWLDLLSPASVSAREHLVGPIETAATLSLYPAATRYQLARTLMVAGMFFLGAQLFYRRKHQQVLCAVAALNGLALAYFGLFQHVTGSDLIYWSFRPTDGGTFFGPFANRNNAGCTLNLSLAAGLALFLNAANWRRHTHNLRIDEVDDSLLKRLCLYPRDLLRQFAHLGPKKLVILGLLALTATGILVSSSRTALLALIASCVATWVMTRFEQRSKTSLVGWGFAISLLLVWFFASDFLDKAAWNKLSTLKDPEQLLQDGRLEHWPLAMAAACNYWLTGSGLGTYRFVYRMFESGHTTVWFQHAENQYLEILVETGIVGLALLAAWLWLVARSSYRLGKRPQDSWSRAVALAGTFILAGQAVHALFDFGIGLTGNALLFALLLGSVSGRDANLLHAANAPARFECTGTNWRRVASIAGGGMAALASVITVMEIAHRAQMDAAVHWPLVTQLTEETSTGPELVKSIHKLEPQARELVRIQLAYALQTCPDDAEGHLALAQSLIDEYRIAVLHALAAETHGQLDRESLRALATISQLRQSAQLLLDSQSLVERDELLHAPLISTWLRPALAHLQAARAACPLLPEVHWQLAQLGFLSAAEPNSSQQLERVRLLASGSATFWFRQGQVALELHHLSDALSSWRRSLALSRQYQTEILAVAHTLFTPEQVATLLPEDPWNLLQLQADSGNVPELARFRELLVRRIETNLASIRPSTADQWFRISQFNHERGRIEESCEQLKHAVHHAPDNTSLRYQYAVRLFGLCRLAEARTQLAICLVQQPQNQAAEDLLEQILTPRVPSGGEPLMRMPAAERRIGPDSTSARL